MKKNFYYFSLLLGLVLGMTMFTACGGDDDDGSPSVTSDLAKLNGIYSGSGIVDGTEWTIVIDFDGKGNSEYTFYAYVEGYGQNVIRNVKNSTYTYDSSTGVMKLYDNDEKKYITWTITNLSGTSFQLYQETWNTSFGMTRNSDSAIKGKKSSSGSSSSGGGSSSGEDSSSGEGRGYDGGSSSRTKCKLCGGSGKCSNYRTSSKLYCGGDGKCSTCNGKGYWTSGLGDKINCESCDSPGYNPGLIGISGRLGDGKCSECHGSGKCKDCGGDGYI